MRVDRIQVRYGGLTAVDGVSLHAPPGRITGLIGPNGAGKTTTFNACSGLVRPTTGSIRLNGEDVTRLSPQARAQRKLGRTFQRMELYESLGVRANVALGREAGLAASTPLRHLTGRRDDKALIRDVTDMALHTCGLSGLAEQRAADLPTGQRRLVELARCLAGDFDILLLDEPSSGLDRAETQRFGDVLLETVRSRGLGILIVEHDMSLVMRVCDYVHVMDFGKPVFEGTPEEVGRSPVVRAAYLGSDAVEDALDAADRIDDLAAVR